MFKKPPVLQSRSVLKSSVARAVRQQIADAFPLLTAADLQLLFPAKSSLSQDKLSHPPHTAVYYVTASRPLFFSCPPPAVSATSASSAPQPALFLPTVYALWLCPQMLPALYIRPPTSHFLLQGADLMLPGVLLPSPAAPLGGYSGWQLQDRMCVMCRGNPAPFAVGVMVVEEEEVRRRGWVGRGVKVLHVWGDGLWGSGDRVVPNEGYMGGEGGRKLEALQLSEEDMREMVEKGMEEAREKGESLDEWDRLQQKVDSKYGKRPDVTTSPTAAQQIDEKKAEDHSTDAQTPPRQQESAPVDGAAQMEQLPQVSEGAATAESADALAEQMQTARIDDGPAERPQHEQKAAAKEEEEEEEPEHHADGKKAEEEESAAAAVPVELMDRSLVESLLLAIRLHLDGDCFPLTPSVLLSSFMERASPWPHRLDLKRSSYKKMSKFVAAMQKRALLSTKQSRGEAVIVSVHREHPDVRAVDAGPEYQRRLRDKAKLRERTERERRREDDDDEEEGGDAHGKRLEADKRLLQIHRGYKPDAGLRELLWPEQETVGVLSMQEARQRLTDYLQEQRLESGNGVRLNPQLSRLLPSPPLAAAASSSSAAVVPKAALFKAVESHLALHHAITTTASASRLRWLKGDAPPVAVSVESRQGRKVVTRVSGLERYAVDTAEFAREAQRLWASSATTAENVSSGSKKGWKDALIQGDIRDGVADKLHELYDIPTQCVEVNRQKKR